jgi:hypothetical protein
MLKDLPVILRLSGVWVIFVVWSQISGWGLSWLEALNTRGYLFSSLVLLAAVAVFLRKTPPQTPLSLSFSRGWRHLKSSPAIIAWCIVATLIVTGAVLHAPSNYDAVTYRLPRTLYWLQENQWHWIDGLDHRQNVSAVGFEWMMAPWLAFTRSDRLLFLINFLPFLLLPGLFFVAARGLGIRGHLARWWMWVWPMAYGITLQAGSIGNDLVPAALALASLAFAAHSLRGRPLLCLFLSALAAAAMTGSKATSLPLCLPIGGYWLWVALKTLGWRRASGVAFISLPLALPASFLPIALACTIHTGVWTGNPNNRHGAEAGHPVAGIVGNSLEILGGMVQPPLLPESKTINTSLQKLFEDDAWYRWALDQYPRFVIAVGQELPMEEYSGIGLGVTTLLLLTLLSRIFVKSIRNNPHSQLQRGILVALTVAVLVFLSKMGVGGAVRLSLPYLPLLILCFLFGVRQRRRGRCLSMTLIQVLPALCILPALILNPNRPLLPVKLLSTHEALPPAFKQRIAKVYAAYQNRASILAPLQAQVPAGVTIGFAGGEDHSALGLFKPYGTRRVVNFSPRTEDKVNWIIATELGFERRMGVSLNEWEAQKEFGKVTDLEIVSKVSAGPEKWGVYKRIR